MKDKSVNILPLTLFKEILEKSWDKDTCYPQVQREWTVKNPAFGQCAVTSLFIQEYFGGELVFCKHFNHYWNRLPDGKEIDLTRDQFKENIELCIDEVKTRDYVLMSKPADKAMTNIRYQILKKRFQKILLERNLYRRET